MPRNNMLRGILSFSTFLRIFVVQMLIYVKKQSSERGVVTNIEYKRLDKKHNNRVFRSL
jgi:hypothetical protein